MKDFYYILGVNQQSSFEEIKKAYRKLSNKFHPDKNDGDEFFTDRFKELQEAYETLSDPSKRKNYNKLYNESKLTYSEEPVSSKTSNSNPVIEFFKSDKQSFEFEEEVTFYWKTINADKVSLKPFGVVPPIGNKTYRIKDFKHEFLIFELIAENSNISRKAATSLKLRNKTYQELYTKFQTKIENENKSSRTNDNSESSNKNFRTNETVPEETDKIYMSKNGVFILNIVFWGFLIISAFVMVFLAL